ncbi:MAG: glucose 1-dehydrogenase [Alphaproteobacteria bacterium]|nr:glucose 1-dehydrogenase [Alphaproteobacteria bacterium]
MRLKNRVAVITGATRGIGRAAAVKMAQEGASIVATGRDEAAGAETVRLVTQAGGQCVFQRQDVTQDDDWARVMDTAMARLGGVDIVVNNAGMFFVKPLADTTDADWEQSYRVNVEGVWLGVKHGFSAMARTGRGGAIVNVSSLMGLVGYPNAVAYCATKGAITGMTRAAAMEGAEMRPQVRVNTLHPGVIWTEMITGQFGDSKELADSFAADTPLRAVGQPEDMADAIIYLACDESSYVTGASLTVDGGRGAD